VPSTNRLKGFKLLTTSNAYWKGDAKGTPMQRVYGTAFFSEKELQAHLQRIEEAKKRDPPQRRERARAVHVSPVGAGRRVLAPQGHDGSTTRSANYMRGVLLPRRLRPSEERPLDYNKAPAGSGPWHWSHYRQQHVPHRIEGETMSGQADETARHFLMYASDVRSIPRSADSATHEQTPLHRNEASACSAA
jgi:threonyl-tRNA synthetase